MEIIFYNNKSSNNTLNKTITETFRTSGTLRDETSIVDPVIMLDKSVNVINSNYCYIPQFNRYYYIVNVTTSNNRLWMVTMHVDVLMSFKSDIQNTSGIVARQENNYNKKLVDNELPVTNDVDIYNYTFGSQPFNTGNYVVAIATGFEKRGE